jgi:hypothetical protein
VRHVFTVEASMMESWRPLVLAAALCVTVGVGDATAQTVFVRNAPPGSATELVLNSATIASATADRGGNTMLLLKLPPNVDQTDVHFYVDLCDNLRRVLLVERGLQPSPPQGSCERKEIVGFFVVGRVTTFVVELSGSNPAVWLRQGPVPPEWLTQQGPEGELATTAHRPSPKGLVLFGGGGFTSFRDAFTLACGNVSPCDGSGFRRAVTVGAAVWATRFFAIEGSYIKPADVHASGSGSTYRFESSLNTSIFTFTGNLGVPAGPVRIYGKVGANYHRAVSTATETIDDVTLTQDDGTTQTVKGGTQTSAVRTAGWGWLFGGGIEGWVTNRFAIYGEAGYLQLKGSPVGGGESGLNDRVTLLLLGVRIHLGR